MLLTIENLSVSFGNANTSVCALDKVSLCLSSNETLGIIGESGSGKTTLGLSIMGLLTQANIYGEIEFDGCKLMSLNGNGWRKVRWKRIAMVFQNALEVFNPVITVGEQVAEPLITHMHLPKEDALAKVSELFKMTGLEPKWRNAYAHELSGGMRQRVLIAMGIACQPELLIVDEPTSALDPVHAEEVVRLLLSLQQRLGFAMILISHNLTVVKKLTSRMITLYAGQIVEQGRTAEVLRAPRHPYTRGLIQSAPDLNPYKDLWGIVGEPPHFADTPGCPFQPRCNQSVRTCKSQRPELTFVGVERQVACHKGGIETILIAKDIVKTFSTPRGYIRAVDGVDLQLQKGEVAALVGPSGCGKSTLAHMLCGVSAPDEGEVYFEGQRVIGNNVSSIMAGMQIVFQDPAEAVSSRFTVLEAVREPLDIMKWESRSKRDEKVFTALAGVHLPVTPNFLQRSCHGLSGGQRQRLAVARAMVTDPKLLIADEITSFLDPSTQATLVRELKGLQNRCGFSMLFITHDLQLARKVADTVYVMENGGMQTNGAAFEMLDVLSESPMEGNFPNHAVRQ